MSLAAAHRMSLAPKKVMIPDGRTSRDHSREILSHGSEANIAADSSSCSSISPAERVTFLDIEAKVCYNFKNIVWSCQIVIQGCGFSFILFIVLEGSDRCVHGR